MTGKSTGESTGESTGAKVFTIPAGLPFVDVLAAGISERWGTDPAALAGVTVLVPTRRARRGLTEAFLRQSEGRPLLLPRMIALGDLDEDDILFAGGFAAEEGATSAGLMDVPPALSGLRRQLLLMKLVMARDAETSPDQAANLSLELARLLDQVHTERLSFDGLRDLAPDNFAEHWQQTLDFLKLLTDAWPGVLEAEGAIDAADRRNRLFDAQKQVWTDNPPTDPVIAAGSTGSIPATADLLALIARLPEGGVILPGLDMDATPEAWAALGEHHPQFGMARLLGHLEVRREDVKSWQASEIKAEPSPRSRLINGALTPADSEAPTTLSKKELEQALDGVSRIDCPGPRIEAAVIALIMRRTLESPGKTAALVTPDRGLARRVAAELRRWRIEVDDSAGLPLGQTPPGAFLLLCARMIADDLAPVAMLAALKHPLAAGATAAAAFRAQVRRLEVAALRGARPASGIAGLRAALDVSRESVGDLKTFLQGLEKIFAPFSDTLSDKTNTLPDVLAAHVEMAEALAQSDTETGAARLWRGDAGEAAANFVSELRDAARDFGALTAADYPALLETLMQGRSVRPRYGDHPRLHIWGLLEARMQQADTVILGGLNEATWPPEARSSPWMSRPMLKQFGLALPERLIGLQAHDFVQGFSSPQVYLTRSDRVDGTPTVASRWLLRLDNFLERLGAENSINAKDPWVGWVDSLDEPEAPRPVTEPRPAPPVEARPRELSVTQVETWIRDPYAVYARHILKLRPLEAIDAEPGAADRGLIIHAALHAFLEKYGDDLPEDAERQLLEIGRRVFKDWQVPPGVDAFWWPRFERIAGWFIDYEKNRRDAGFKTVATEIKGAMDIDGPGGAFRLTARADRIDRRADIGLAVMDYKTGQTPTAPQVEAGLSPQLPLEAAIAEAGGFKGLKAETTAQLVYLSLSGGRTPGEEKTLKLDVPKTVNDTLKGLQGLVAQYDNPDMPYLSQPRPMRLESWGDYDHLARILEWRGKTGDGPGGGNGE
ncbi:MAG: double-strand break repair protein AddB [Rhodospirillales bacterium]|nr:double-strand break repair protein AddB [Rhodospirillales bacterium]